MNILASKITNSYSDREYNRVLMTNKVDVGEYYYIYDLGEEYWWRWPDPKSNCDSQGYLSHTHALYSGMGPPILPESGLFLTWHFSLFSSLYNRLKRSKRRTYDPNEASLFIIPYDMGLDGYADTKTCKNRRTCTNGHVKRLREFLSKTPYFRRHDTVDHVVLWSLGQYHPWPHNQCDVFMRDDCKRCAFTCYWMDSTKQESKFISVPFPSGYHWWDGIKSIPWAVNSTHRNITAVYLGSTNTLNPAHTKIRRAMTQQCLKSSQCLWMQIGHSSIDNNIADYLSVYRKSIFCLCPPGDDPARKALFDSILSGCIPVVFQVATLYNQYWWHIGEEEALDISVYIPGEAVRAGKIEFMTELLKITPEVIKKKQEALSRIAPRVQYAMPPLEYLKNVSDATPWDPPFPDGVDILLDGLFDRAAKLKQNLSSNLPPKVLSNRDWGKQYENVRIQIPTKILTQNLSWAVGSCQESGRCYPNSSKLTIANQFNFKADITKHEINEPQQLTRKPERMTPVSELLMEKPREQRKPSSTVWKLSQRMLPKWNFQPKSELSKKLFYIYDLDEEYWWRWPDPKSDCDSQDYLSHTHALYSGMGPPILPESGLFLTWHFSLFSSLYNRLKRSKRRTYDPNEASLFIIPYDMGLDGSVDPNTCKNRRTCTYGLAPKLAQYMNSSPYFNRYNGLDHVLLWSLGQYHPWPHNACDTFLTETCKKCAVTCYWMDGKKPESRFISVPFPSGYHWWDGIKDIPWNSNQQRNLTAVYLGSTQTLNPTHTKIRRAMAQQCRASNKCHWIQIGHSSTGNNIATLLTVYRRAVFCLCPPGDDPARKALFDAILSGCIPVVYELNTLYNQYPYHIGEETALDISVYIPGNTMRSGHIDTMKVLLNISSEIIKKKQEALARIAPRVQYAMPPLEYLKNISDATPWDPPFPDGVDILLDGLFHRAERLVSNKSSGIPLRVLSSREWGKEYDTVKVKVPGEAWKSLYNTSIDGQQHGVDRDMFDSLSLTTEGHSRRPGHHHRFNNSNHNHMKHSKRIHPRKDNINNYEP